jgi:hypothetical protein
LEESVPGVTTFLLSQGVLGAFCLILLAAVWRLFGLYADSQEKRITEGRETVTAVLSYANAIEQLAELIKAGPGRGA